MTDTEIEGVFNLREGVGNDEKEESHSHSHWFCGNDDSNFIAPARNGEDPAYYEADIGECYRGVVYFSPLFIVLVVVILVRWIRSCSGGSSRVGVGAGTAPQEQMTKRHNYRSRASLAPPSALGEFNEVDRVDRVDRVGNVNLGTRITLLNVGFVDTSRVLIAVLLGVSFAARLFIAEFERKKTSSDDTSESHESTLSLHAYLDNLVLGTLVWFAIALLTWREAKLGLMESHVLGIFGCFAMIAGVLRIRSTLLDRGLHEEDVDSHYQLRDDSLDMIWLLCESSFILVEGFLLMCIARDWRRIRGLKTEQRITTTSSVDSAVHPNLTRDLDSPLLGSPLLRSIEENTANAEHAYSAETEAGLFSRLFFLWFDPIVQKGYKEPLQDSDFYNLREDDKSRLLSANFNQAWEELLQERKERLRTERIHPSSGSHAGGLFSKPRDDESSANAHNGDKGAIVPSNGNSDSRTNGSTATGTTSASSSDTGSNGNGNGKGNGNGNGNGKDSGLENGNLGIVVRALHRSGVLTPFYQAAILKFIYDSLIFVGPQLLNALVEFMNDESDPPLSKGLTIALGMFINAAISTLVLHQYFHLVFRAGLRVRASLVTAIYQKSLRITPSARASQTTGTTLTLMSTDCQRLQNLFPYLHIIWSSPWQIILCLYFLWQQLQYSVFVAIAIIMFLMTPLTFIVGRRTKSVQGKVMEVKEKRIGFTGEMLAVMKTLKLYSWDWIFRDRIKSIRLEELSHLRRYVVLRAMARTLWTATPTAVTLGTFAAYTGLMGKQLTPATAWTSLTLLSILRFPLAVLPNIFNGAIEASVSLRRIEAFLEKPELGEDGVTAELSRSNPPSPSSNGGTNNYVAPSSSSSSSSGFDGSASRTGEGDQDSSNSADRVVFRDSLLSPYPTTAFRKRPAGNPVSADDATNVDGSGFPSPLDISSSAGYRQPRHAAYRSANNIPHPTPGGLAIEMVNGNFYWDDARRVPALHDVELRVTEGSVCCVIGDTGSGKTALMLALIGDLQPSIEDPPFVGLYGTRAYSAQVPWILNATVRDNILFDTEYDEAWYRKVVHACALESDFEILTNRDETEIGERGINLSGGQKARISLARAIYSRSDIVLLESCFEAVDEHVGAHIWKYCFEGILQDVPSKNGRKRTVLLVTHALQNLNKLDKIIVMREGKVSLQGTYDHLIQNESFSHVLDVVQKARHVEHTDEEQGNGDTAQAQEHDDGAGTALDNSDSKRTSSSPTSKAGKRTSPQRQGAASSDQTGQGGQAAQAAQAAQAGQAGQAGQADQSNEHPQKPSDNTTTSSKKSGKLTQDEERAVGQVDWEVYYNYVRMTGGWGVALLVLILLVLRTVGNIGTSRWLAYWSASVNSASSSPSSSSQASAIDSDNFGLLEEDHATSFSSEQPTFVSGSDFRWNSSSLSTSCDVGNTHGSQVMSRFLEQLPGPQVAEAHSGYSHQSDGILSFIQDNLNRVVDTGIAAAAPHSTGYYLEIYALLSVATMVFIAVSTLHFSLVALGASNNMHNGLIDALTRAPTSFFDVTPVGRMLNRCSKDIYALDEDLPASLYQFLSMTVDNLGTIIMIAIVTPWFMAAMPILGFFYRRVQQLYIATSREVKRWDSVLRSPIYSHFGESLDGVTSIRAYGVHERFTEMNHAKLSANLRAYYASITANRWLAVRLEFIGNLLVFSAAGFVVIRQGEIDSSLAGLAVSYALTITQSLNWTVRMVSELETNIVSVERIEEYSKTPSEAPEEPSNPSRAPPATWPQHGRIRIQGLRAKYRPDLEEVIKGIDIDIQPGEKIGVCGRTGSGKSSLLLLLTRIIEPSAGVIEIDGFDTQLCGLRQLRDAIAVIPQDPVLFAGSVRFNLDPGNLYEDADLWRALETTRIAQHIRTMDGGEKGLDAEIAEGGSNMSFGQRQLFCIARAVLRKSKILLLDEATSGIDPVEDQIVQETFRSEQFKQSTTVTVAHRLGTIMSSDRIAFMDDGLIAELGAPRDLMNRRSGKFRSLVDSMSGGHDGSSS